MYEYNATYVKNYDGDTATFIVDLGFGITYKIKGRFNRINTPELRSKDELEQFRAYKAKTMVEETIKHSETVVIRTIKDRKGKYGRYLVEVICDGVNLNDLLLENGLADPY